MSQLQEGRPDEALVSLQAARQSGGSWTPLGLIGYTRAVSGQTAAAGFVLGELMAARRSSYVPPYTIATVHAGLGDAASALQWLERGFDERDVRMVFLRVDPTWSALRREPGFMTLLRRMNLGPSAEAGAARYLLICALPKAKRPTRRRGTSTPRACGGAADIQAGIGPMITRGAA